MSQEENKGMVVLEPETRITKAGPESLTSTWEEIQAARVHFHESETRAGTPSCNMTFIN